MIESRVQKKLKNDETVISVKTNFMSPPIVEQIGHVGFDCVWICQEHLWANPETLASMIKSARLTGMDAMVRIEKEGYFSASKQLEMGAKGIMVPHVTTPKEAEFWVRSAKFHPGGRRAIDGVNADADWGMADFNDYLEFSNEQTFLMLQIEDKEALDQLEDIIKVENVDIFFVGPGDLSQSFGFPGETDRKEIQDTLKRVGELCQRYGTVAGAPAGSVSKVDELIDMGYRFFNVGGDLISLLNGLKGLRKEFENFI